MRIAAGILTIIGGLIGPGPAGTIVPVDIEPFTVLPLLVFCIVIGVIFLRPTFIEKHGAAEEITELRELKESAEPAAEPTAEPSEIPATPEALEADPIEKEMPEVAPPTASADTMADLRGLLTELGI